MKNIKYMALLVLILFIISGCDIFIEDESDIKLTIIPSSSVIEVDEDSTEDFYFTVKLKSDTPVQIEKYSVRYRETPGGESIESLSYEENLNGYIYLNESGDEEEIKGVAIAGGYVADYMERNSKTALYADVDFYFDSEAGNKIKVEPPIIEIRYTDVVPVAEEVKEILVYDEDEDGKLDKIEVVFPDYLDRDSVPEVDDNAFEIDNNDYQIKEIEYSSKIITLEIEKVVDKADTYNMPNISYSKSVWEIKYSNGQICPSFTYNDITEKDKASPVGIKAEYASGKLEIEFSESIIVDSEKLLGGISAYNGSNNEISNFFTGKEFSVDTNILEFEMDDAGGVDYIIITDNSVIKDINSNQVSSEKIYLQD